MEKPSVISIQNMNMYKYTIVEQQSFISCTKHSYGDTKKERNKCTELNVFKYVSIKLDLCLQLYVSVKTEFQRCNIYTKKAQEKVKDNTNLHKPSYSTL